MDEALQYLLDAVLMFECYCDDEPEGVWLTQATEFLRSLGVFPPNTGCSGRGYQQAQRRSGEEPAAPLNLGS